MTAHAKRKPTHAKQSYFAVSLLVVVLATVATGCARSRGYQQDSDYYQDGNRRESATVRAERFGQPKKRIFVFPFVNATPVGGAELGQFIADELSREIRQTRKAIVAENLHVTETSADFFNGDKVRMGVLTREGKRLGVSLLVLGRIKRVTYRRNGDDVGLFRQKSAVAAVDLEMRVYDVTDAKEVVLDERSADSSSNQFNIFGNDDDSDPRSARVELVQMALRQGAQIFARDAGRVIEKISWEGRIAKITGVQVYINAGRITGLNIGDILKVMTLGEDIYDPLTGAYLGRSRGQPKGTLEVVDYLGADGAITVVHSGGNFVENDIVQLY